MRKRLKSVTCSSVMLICLLFVSETYVLAKNRPFNSAASYELIKRILPRRWRSFKVMYLKSSDNNNTFKIKSDGNIVTIYGNSGVAVASGFYFYLKNYCHCQVTWEAQNLHLPEVLPTIVDSVQRNSPYEYSYYLNYCTFSYSMCWWNWERWEKEIDWMAMHGINMPLSLTGQNLIWYNVYRKLGFSNSDLSSFFSGPAHFGWFWMGNLDAEGGPLSHTYLLNQVELQRKILLRERELGMKPVLPSFTGHVPPSFNKYYPQSSVKKISWGDFHTCLLSPADSMFSRIGTMFLKEMIKMFGTDHFYSSDSFNENTPPTSDTGYLSQISHAVYKSMETVDSSAKWVMQGWLFTNNPSFWRPSQIKALFNGVPDDKLIVLDLWSESKPVWNQTNAYYGRQWVWCMLLNFGGNTGMFGKMDAIASIPSRVLRDSHSGKMMGLGLTPEGIEQNPVMYELMTDNIWRNTPIELDAWLKNYIIQRYGRQSKALYRGWQILRKTVYNGDDKDGAPESIITARPTFEKNTVWTRTSLYYHLSDVLPAWKFFMTAAPELKSSEAFKYDLVDLTRQILATYADSLQQEVAESYWNENDEKFIRKSHEFLSLLDDLDMLLSSQKDFLLGKWTNAAWEAGNGTLEKRRFLKEAKQLITVWGERSSSLHEYACKQWGGMIKDFYRPRWRQYFSYADSCLKQHIKIDQKAFEHRMINWEWAWVEASKIYTQKPQGNTLSIVEKLYKKYYNRVDRKI